MTVEDKKRYRLFLDACSAGQASKVQAMLADGLTINDDPQDSASGGALGRAAYYGHAETVQILLEAGADVHAYNEYALRHACRNSRLEVVKLLLKNGADVHANEDEIVRELLFRPQSAYTHYRWRNVTPLEDMQKYVKRYFRLEGIKQKETHHANTTCPSDEG